MALVQLDRSKDRNKLPSAFERDRVTSAPRDVAAAGFGTLMLIAGLRSTRGPATTISVLGFGLACFGVARLLGVGRLVDASPYERTIAQDRNWRAAAVITRSVTIGRPREEVYRHWRNLPNLAQASDDIVRVELLDGDGRRSRWVMKGPGGARVFLLARMSEDEPGRLIAWESDRSSTVRHFGRIEFRDAPSERGCEVHLTLAYEPPMGRLGQLVAKIMRREPGVQARDALRRLKQVIEVGEIATSKTA
jgi:uncharacterized membrane protein